MSHWYCPTCKERVEGILVKHNETHERCGTYVLWVDGRAEVETDDLRAKLTEVEDECNRLVGRAELERRKLESALRAKEETTPQPPPLDGQHGGPLVLVEARYEDGSVARLDDGWRWVDEIVGATVLSPVIKTERRGWTFTRNSLRAAGEVGGTDE